MTYSQADLDMAERHVAQARRHVLEQEERITRLRSVGCPTEQAEDLLQQFHATLIQHAKHRDAIEAALHPLADG